MKRDVVTGLYDYYDYYDYYYYTQLACPPSPPPLQEADAELAKT